MIRNTFAYEVRTKLWGDVKTDYKFINQNFSYTQIPKPFTVFEEQSLLKNNIALIIVNGKGLNETESAGKFYICTYAWCIWIYHILFPLIILGLRNFLLYGITKCSRFKNGFKFNERRLNLLSIKHRAKMFRPF